MKGLSTPSAQGVAFALLAYGTWGGFPLFFALFDGVGALEILAHRVIWSCLFLALVISLLKRWSVIANIRQAPRQLLPALACALLIGANWGLYIYSVESHRVLQASLGYFMTPLVNVALGVVVLKERVAPTQRLAIGLALGAIVLQLFQLGTLPWLSLCLAVSFGTYGLLRKQLALDGLSGLFIETLLLLPLALLLIQQLPVSHFDGALFFTAPYSAALLMASGVLTALPLLAFAGAARRLTLGTLGFLMYINPTLQFLIALWVFNEPLAVEQLTTFVLIWIALALYSWSSLRQQRRVPT
ncbi:EamA family transporter RarD [Halomonas sp. EF61]|uniref:EamA family transporter RarD n=1 Tax=Halomonas sp. EF61 TaxID=2950869 RepID=UPI0032DF3711